MSTPSQPALNTRSPIEGKPEKPGEEEVKAGFLERITGGYATSSDKAGMFAIGALGALTARRTVIAAHPSAGLGEELAATIAGGELTAGSWVGSGERAQRWFRAQDQDLGQTLAFAAVHVHPMAVAAFSPKGQRLSTLVRGAVMYAATLGATAAVVTRPDADRHTWAWGATAALSTLSITTAKAPRGWGWLGPAYATRMMVGFAAGQ